MTAVTRTSGEQALAVGRLLEAGIDIDTAVDLVRDGCDAITASEMQQLMAAAS